jgi:nucleoside-diphosphate-sugar epimerase
MRKKGITVTGGAGFLGQYVVAAFATIGWYRESRR